jgi:hypothetical protein
MTLEACNQDPQRLIQINALGFSGEPENYYAGVIGWIMNQWIG